MILRPKWIVTSFLLMVSAYFLMRSLAISSESASSHDESQQKVSYTVPHESNEWPVKTVFDVRVWVAQNVTSRDLARTIHLFMEARDFSEENLKRVFIGFAEEYSDPYNLVIYCFSDKAVIERHLMEQRSTAVYTRQESVSTGYFRAVYYRMNGEESMTYSPAPDKDDSIRIVLKEKVVAYSGNTDQDLLRAIEEGDTDQARKLLAKGANVNAVNSEGDNALMLAVLNEHTEIANLLLERTEDLDHKNNEGWTALMYAAVEGETKTAKALIRRGAEVNVRNQHGYTPLILAASRGHRDIVKLLLSKGGDVNARENNGRTALSLIQTSLGPREQNVMADLLKSAGAKE